MKTNIKLLGTLLLITFLAMIDLKADPIDGIWISRDQQIRMEIENYDRGIRINQPGRGWSNYRRVGDRYQNGLGSFFRIIDNQSIEWYDRNQRTRHVLFRENRNRRGYNDPDYYGNQDRYYNNRNRGYQDLRNIEGNWYNESTGQHIHVKTRRGKIMVKFHGERWIDFVRGRHGNFVDEYGNHWQIYRDQMVFKSFNRDLSMKFYKGTYHNRGSNRGSYFHFRD